MPPRKPPQGQSQRSLAQVTASSYERKPQPLPPTQDSSTVPPLWVPPSTPKELFPEWPDAATLSTENWGSEETPYEDPTALTVFLGGCVDGEAAITWKRPREFLPPIAEPTAAAASTLAPVVPDAKHGSKKAAPPPTAKKTEPEQPKKPKEPKYAHILYVTHPETDHHHHGTLAQQQTTTTADAKKHAAASHPSTPAVLAPPQPPPRRIVRDFRRVWSAEQQEELALWRKEEERIEHDKQHRERVYMEFEDATAFIINGRPWQPLNEDDVHAEDLEDDGENDDGEGEGAQDGSSLDNSPYGGMLPPPRMDITSNAIIKPEVPHGDVVQPELASYLRAVDHLYQHWTGVPLEGSEKDIAPYLWESIYPQDVTGVPIYNPGGKYSVRLFVAGKWRKIDVDDKLPLDEEGNIQIVSSLMKNELWVVILAKALIKAAAWSDVAVGALADINPSESIRLAALTITCLTGWKVTRHSEASTLGGNYQVLQEFMPEAKLSDGQDELVLDSLDDATEPSIQSPMQSEEDKSATPKPRLIACSISSAGIADLSYREVSVVQDVVGDPGNITLKTVNLNGPASIHEESILPGRMMFLIVHPPLRYADQVFEAWHSDHSGSFVPFTNSPTQFCVISSMKIPEPQADADTVLVAGNDFVDVVVTLSRITPIMSSTERAGTAGSRMANLLGVDPRGSVMLVEDLELDKFRARSKASQAGVKTKPLVFKLDTSSSMLLRLPRGEYDTMTFRVYPQSTCRFGYNLLVESNVKVDLQISNTYWRNVWDLQVIEGDGAYPVLLENSWNILFKQSIELTPPVEATAGLPHMLPELYIDLQLSDPDLVPFVHAYFVNQASNQVISLVGLHAGAVLPHEGATWTLIVECRPRAVIREGKWHLTVGSNRFFKHASIHQPRLTMFSGVYEPNKPLICLRDVVIHPKKTTSTSLEFQLLNSGSRDCDDLTAMLEVIDMASGDVLVRQTGRGFVRLLQLPPSTKSPDDPSEEKSGYIVQGGIDPSTCVVSDWLRSIRPFSYKKSNGNTPKEAPIDEAQVSQGTVEGVATPDPHQVTWRLLCWSVDEVKLEFDRTQELRFDAIRASWAEAAKDREAHGVSSRLLFLGKTDAAEAAMTEDGLTEDLVARYKARSQWLQQATTRISDVAECDHLLVLPECPPGDELLRTAEEFARARELNQAKHDETAVLLRTLRDERAAVKEIRETDLKELAQSFRDTRKETQKQQQALYAHRDDVRAVGPSARAAG